MDNIYDFYSRKSKRYFGIILGLLFLTAACSPKIEKSEEESITIPIAEIKKERYEMADYFPGVASGINNVEVRPQVSGYLDKILVDEGAYVKKGQVLFIIQEKTFQETYQSATASTEMAQSLVKKGQIEYDRIKQLERANVLSNVQLQTAKEELDFAKAAVRKAEADEKLAAIKKSFTHIIAPVSGYIGRIPYKKGALVGLQEKEPLTVLSDISEIHIYFSMSETDFLKFKSHYSGSTIEEKIKRLPPVQLQLPDESIFSENGKIDLVLGQFDAHTAAINFRATFKNTGNLLRSGNTGRIILPKYYDDVIKIPQSATFKIQDKIMVYTVEKDNTVHLASLKIRDKDEHHYVVSEGVDIGNRIVSKGADRLKEGQRINPVNE